MSDDRGSNFHQAIRDEKGYVDIAYYSLFWVMLVTVGSIPIVMLMSVLEFWRCVPLITDLAVVNCFYKAPGADVGFICGGFSTALIALAGYMAATRPPRAPSIGPTQNITANSVTQEAAP